MEIMVRIAITILGMIIDRNAIDLLAIIPS